MIAVIGCLAVLLVLEFSVPAWWWVMIVPFAHGAAVARSGGKAFRTGLFSAGLLWLGASLVLFFTGSRTVAGRMAGMFGLGEGWLMIAATALVAAAAAAVSGHAGHSLRTLLKKK